MVFQSNPADLLPAGVILLAPGEGRHYSCGPMQSVFLADGEETGGRYSVSIWRVDAGKARARCPFL